MKRWIAVAAALLIAAGCGGGGSGGGSSSQRSTVHGVAAVGAYLPQGAALQIRSVTVGTTPTSLMTTTLGQNGSYSVDVTGVQGPFLIRVHDDVANTWYYSFEAAPAGVANVNPLSDKLIRYWYLDAINAPGNPGYVNIDDVFVSGVWAPGTKIGGVPVPAHTPIVLPNPDTMAKASNTLSLTFGLMYNVPNIENLLTTAWVPGESFDQILDMDANAPFNAGYIAQSATVYPDFLVSYYFYTQIVGGKEMLFGQVDAIGGSVVVSPQLVGSETMTLVSTTGGVSHFVMSVPIALVPPFDNSLAIFIDGYNPGYSCLIVHH